MMKKNFIGSLDRNLMREFFIVRSIYFNFDQGKENVVKNKVSVSNSK